jgi:hypothetical protein
MTLFLLKWFFIFVCGWGLIFYESPGGLIIFLGIITFLQLVHEVDLNLWLRFFPIWWNIKQFFLMSYALIVKESSCVYRKFIANTLFLFAFAL